jgi:hypothetical protein
MKRSSLSSLALILLTILVNSCKEKAEPWSILEFKGDGIVANFSKGYMTIFYSTDTTTANSVLAERGDIILYGENSITSFGKNPGSLLSFKSDKECAYINGKLRSITIPDKAEKLSAFLVSDTTDYSYLEFIVFSSDVPESLMPFLTRLSKIRPDAGLSIENDQVNLAEILGLFDPRIILGSGINFKDFGLLSAEPSLETLLLSVNDSLETKPLPAMAKLEQLIIEGSDKAYLTDENYFENNPQVERLSLISFPAFECAILKPLTNLRELIIFECDTVLSAALIKNHKSLEVLNPMWDDFKYDITEKDLPNLKWITISSELSQSEFESFIDSNPGLEVVEIMRNFKINNLQPLLSLKNLYGLTVVDTLTDINTMKSLKTLKYLSLPEKVISDSIKKASIRQALPGTILASNEGVCLGSGWLLLLIPFIVLFRFISMKKRV